MDVKLLSKVEGVLGDKEYGAYLRRDIKIVMSGRLREAVRRA
jgi:hypothetical protein